MNVRLWLHYLRHEPQFNRALVYYCRVFTLQHKTTWGNCCHYLNNIELNCMGTSQCHHCAPLLNVSVLLLFIEVCGHLFLHSSMKVPSQPFRRTGVFEVWTLTGPLQHRFFFSNPAVLEIIILFQFGPNWQIASHFSLPLSPKCICGICPDMLAVFGFHQMCCCMLWPSIFTSISSVHIQLYRPKPCCDVLVL